jgi:hypothetical protein
MTCHQGRESKASVDADIAAGSYGFNNIHYLPAASVLMGTDVKVGYEYDGQTYRGKNDFPQHTAHRKTCIECHMRDGAKNHTFLPDAAMCTTCHGGTSFADIGGLPGNNKYDINQLSGILLAVMQNYASALGGTLTYNGNAYPYFGLSGASWDAVLSKASFNYHIAQKEPGAYTHNGTYMKQLLYDSTEDVLGILGGGAAPLMSAPFAAGESPTTETPKTVGELQTILSTLGITVEGRTN